MEDYIDDFDDNNNNNNNNNDKISNEIEMFESLLLNDNKNKIKDSIIGFKGKKSPEENCNLFSKITFSWANSFVVHCYKNVLQLDHIWDLASYDKSSYLNQKMSDSWEIEIKKKNPSYIRAAFRAFGKFYMLSLVFFGINVTSQFVGPAILTKMVNLVVDANSEQQQQNTYMGYIYPFILFFSLIIGSICSYQSNMISVRTGNHLKTVITLDIYKKAIKLSNSSRSNTSPGEIVNLMSNDAQRMADIQVVNNGIFALPLIIISLIMLYLSIGWVTFIGLALMLAAIPFNGIAAKKLTEIRRDLVNYTDKRVKITNEILQAIKIIKLYSWEDSFAKKVINERDLEIKLLFSYSRYRTLLMVFVVALPTAVSILVFSSYYGYYKSLDAAKIFSALAYLNILRLPLGFLPILVSLIAQMNIAGKRITDFLLLPEMHQDIKKFNDHDEPNLSNGVYIRNATLSWNKEKKEESFGLKNISFEASGTSLTMVVGSVGSGKSSMVQAMLGEMDLLEGSVGIKGSIAYVPQQAWIINASLKDNILFGKDYDEAKYQNVLEICALKHDIELFPQGDLVEIGERGVNLSGGQKQRVSIARAVYSDADVYILDDPLSAVDAHVGKHLFHKCFKGILSNKTVILVTNQLNYIPLSDYTFVLKDGKIVEHGTYQQLINDQKEFASILSSYGVDSFDSFTEISNETINHQKNDKKKELKPINKSCNNDGVLVSQEEREEGAVSMWVYWKYATVGGGLLFFFTFIFFLLEAGSKILVDWWLSYWQNETTISTSIDNTHYLLIYISLGIGSVIISVVRNFMFFEYTVYASQIMHHQLFNALLRKPMSFFDTTPLGRIINRFTKDLDNIDHMISTSISVFLLILLSVIATLIMISIIIPYLLIPLAPICVAFYVLQYFYRFTSRELQRLESISRSPIFSHFSETLGGVVSIRAYEKVKENILVNQHLLDNNNKCSLTLSAMYQWLGVRLDFLTSLVTFFTCLFITIKRDTISAASVGLSLSYALSLTGNLNRAALQAADTEAKMNSVERITHYIKGPVESQQIVEKNRPSSEWPLYGAITFDNLVMRYREGLDPVLKGISCEIKAKEKVGIVGRTGAGKSSIVLALFRLIEASEGAILIDGENIAKFGLKDLRRNLAIIPQDPVLFSGTLRENLDPFNESNDDELWNILEDIELKNLIKTMEDGLFTKVLENGENFSVGQRQLICLGRALLRKPKILVLDEATASVDGHSDSLIQTTIRTKFSNCTILTIAHRLNTIMDSDRIMVLDAGRISEFDEPWTLLQNPYGLLTWLVEETGQQNATFLKMLAQTKKDKKKT